MSSTIVNTLAVSCRCVSNSDRPFAVATQWMFSRGLGSIPGSVLFGAIIDSACIFEESSCSGDSTSCLLYSKKQLSVYLFVVSAFFKLATTVLFVAAKMCYQPPPSPSPLPSIILSPNESNVRTNYRYGSGVSSETVTENRTKAAANDTQKQDSKTDIPLSDSKEKTELGHSIVRKRSQKNSSHSNHSIHEDTKTAILSNLGPAISTESLKIEQDSV